MTDEDRKIYIQALLEVQKQNQEVSKTVSTVLIPLLGSFVTLASAIFAISNPSTISVNAANVPYIIAVLLTFQIFVLWDAQWRAGFQQHTEEKLNAAIGADVAIWETMNSISNRWKAAPAYGFNSVMSILWSFSIINGIRSLPYEFGSLFHVALYCILIVFLFLGYMSVFSAKIDGYNFSKHGFNVTEEQIRIRAYTIWEKHTGTYRNDNEIWEQAKVDLKNDASHGTIISPHLIKPYSDSFMVFSRSIYKKVGVFIVIIKKYYIEIRTHLKSKIPSSRLHMKPPKD